MFRFRLPDGSWACITTGPSGVDTVLIKKPKSFEAGDAFIDLELVESSGYTAPFHCVIPHTAIHPETVRGAPENAAWLDVSSSPNAYYAALLDRWAMGETFMVLEHDVTCRPDIVESFDACPEPWCLYQYAPVCECGNPDCREAWRNALGCTRFRSELIAAVPDAMSSIPPDNWEWHNVCDGLGNNLRAAGYTHHFHEGTVHHHRLVQRDGLEQYA